MTSILYLAYALTLVLLVLTWRYRRFLSEPSPIDPTYRPKVTLILAVRGLDPEFERHVESLFALDYPDYEVIFGLAERDDPAYDVLASACHRHVGRAHLVVTGLPWTCSEKIYNVLGCIDSAAPDSEVFVVVDADVHPAPLFLQRLVTPLRDPGVGAGTGYRWLVPTSPTLARVVATMTNAAGAVSFWVSGSVWGGMFAIRREVFQRLDVRSTWLNACSEDLTLYRLLKADGLRIVSVADTLAVSHQDYTWSTYWEFLIRQLIIARVYRPPLWWQVFVLYTATMVVMAYGVFGSLSFLAGWTTDRLPLLALPLLALLMLQGWLVIDGAQRAIRRRAETIWEVPFAALPIFLLAVVVGVLQILASTRRRWILWRGVVYRLHAPDRTEVFRPSKPPPSGAVPVRVSAALRELFLGRAATAEPPTKERHERSA